MPIKEREYTERINVFFTKDQLKQLKAEAEKQGLPVSVYVRMIIVKELNKND